MKRKHKDAMIAMGIKIAALEQIQRNHGQAHGAYDLTPKFTLLVKKVDGMESRMNNSPFNSMVVSAHTEKIADLCKRVDGIDFRLRAEGKAQMEQNRSIYELNARIKALEKMPALIDDHIKRLADHDESIESLSETVDQLSSCKCEAGNQLTKRIGELERAVDTRRGVPVFSEHFPNIMTSISDIQLKMKEQRGDYHDHIAQLVLENKAAHAEMKKTADAARESSNAQASEIMLMREQIKGLEKRLSRAQDMIAEMHKDGFIPVKKRGSCNDSERLYKGEPLKDDSTMKVCETCAHEKAHASHPSCVTCYGSDHTGWTQKKRAASRAVKAPAAKNPAKKGA